MRNIGSKAIDRQYLFNITNTVDPEFFRKEVEQAEILKMRRQMDVVQNNVTVTKEIYEILTHMPAMPTNMRNTQQSRALCMLKNTKRTFE